jgi:hypothetical protein
MSNAQAKVEAFTPRPMPELTVKNLKHAAWASEETQCFSATIYVDGKACFTASNDGHGGATFMHPLDGMAERLFELEDIAKEHTYTCDYDGNPHPKSLEWFVDDAVRDTLELRRIARMLKTRAVFVNDAGELTGYKCNIKKHPLADHIAVLAEKHPGERCVNHLPAAEQFAHLDCVQFK